MSTFVLPPGFAHGSLYVRSVNSPKPAIITFAWEIATPPWNQSDNNDLMTQLQTLFQPLFSSDVSFPQLVTLVGSDGPPLRFVTFGTLSGTRTDAPYLPPNCAVLWAKQTEFSGRRYRGRMFIPYVYEGNVDDSGKLTNPELTLQNTAANALQVALDSAATFNTAGMVLLHSEAPTTPTPVVELSIGSVIATQRRRLVRTS